MKNNSTKQKLVHFNIQLQEIKPYKVKFPSCFSPLPEEFYSYLGKVSLTWGDYEIAFDEFLVSLMNETTIYSDKSILISV